MVKKLIFIVIDMYRTPAMIVVARINDIYVHIVKVTRRPSRVTDLTHPFFLVTDYLKMDKMCPIERFYITLKSAKN
jgi:hypothetical protein